MSWTIQRAILVPYDFSQHSHTAVEKAIALAKDPSQVHILHVLPSFVTLAPAGFPIESVDDGPRVEYAKKLMAGEFQDAMYAGVTQEVLIGDPGTICADRAHSLNAELIVLPSHGRSGVSRLLLGSVTERIVRLATCPVLVLKL